MKNLLIRTASGIVFLAIFLLALLWNPIVFCIIFSAVVLIMLGEYLNITLDKSQTGIKTLTVITGVAFFVLMFLNRGYGLMWEWLMIIPIMIVIIYCLILFGKDKEHYRNTPFAIASLLYIALPFALTNIIAFDPEGNFDGKILLAVMIIIWSSDVGAYVFGMLFGQKHGHKLCPSISPKKSWEGYFGGLFTSLLAGYILYVTGLIRLPLIHSLILSLIVNITGTFGDLAESQLKRNFGVKDAGKIMPGHGGLLDRFDGALFAFPAAVLYIVLISL